MSDATATTLVARLPAQIIHKKHGHTCFTCVDFYDRIARLSVLYD